MTSPTRPMGDNGTRGPSSGRRQQNHGTVHGYRKRGCRCQQCREAATQAIRAWRARRRADGFTHLTHAKSGTYDAGCRCRPCTVAACDARLERRERARLWSEQDSVQLDREVRAGRRHGTPGGARAHSRAGEPLCRACEQWQHRASADRYAKRAT